MRTESQVTKQLTREQNKYRMQVSAAAETNEELTRISTANTDGKYNQVTAGLRTKLARQNAAVLVTEQYCEYLATELKGLQKAAAKK